MSEVNGMIRRVRRMLLLSAAIGLLFALLSVSANAYSYPSMPSNWQSVKVYVGNESVGYVQMPFSRYPSGAYWSPEKAYMTVLEGYDYGLSLHSDLYLRGWECMGFARYAYAALFYRFPQNASIDTSLAAEYSYNYAYRNMISEVLGQRTLSAGYSASTLKTLMTSCMPGAVMRISGHSMVVMAIFDDGLIIYDANFGGSNMVDIRKYTWSEFVEKLGRRGIEALHMPAYHPGFYYSTGYSPDPGGEDPATPTDDPTQYQLDTSKKGTYVVYNCSSLNVRNKPSTNSEVVGSLTPGTRVEVAGTYQDWASIEYQHADCWVSSDYLRESNGTEITVTFDPNGGSMWSRTGSYITGQPFGTLPTAEKADRVLIGWTDGATLYTSESLVPDVEHLTLKAKWGVLTFTDVSENSWYAGNVMEAYSRGLIALSDRYNPDTYASRAQMVTVLGREYESETGTKISSNTNVFADVSDTDYFAAYVNWGRDTGLVMGTSDITFNPYANVTREQIAEFLYRLAIYTGRTIRQDGDIRTVQHFNDYQDISSWAVSSVCWAVNAGLLKGDDTGNVNPQAPAKRSEMIAMFMRFVSYVTQSDSMVSRYNHDMEEEPAEQMPEATETTTETQTPAETPETQNAEPQEELLPEESAETEAQGETALPGGFPEPALDSVSPEAPAA